MSKIGEGHAKAMANLGLDEARGIFFTDSNIAQPTPYGIYGHPTPGEVADARRDLEPEQQYGLAPDSLLAERMRESTSRDEPGREDPEPPMDRD